MATPELITSPKKYIDPISDIREMATNWIATIFFPGKSDINRYHFNKKILSKKEAQDLAKRNKIEMPTDANNYNFFIYDLSRGIIPFNKWDYMIFPKWWYATTDWNRIMRYDTGGTQRPAKHINWDLSSKKKYKQKQDSVANNWKLPLNKKDVETNYFDNKLLNRKEAQSLANRMDIKMPINTNSYSFFIYDTDLGIVPFKKWDRVTTDEWYIETDWITITFYDMWWNVIWTFPDRLQNIV